MRARRAEARSPSRRTEPCARRAGSPRARRARRPASASWRFRRPRAPSRARSRVLPRGSPARAPRHARSGDDDGGVARVAAGALHVLEDRRDPCVAAVAEDVDVELDRVVEEAVDEARPLHVELVRVARDVDAAPADDVMRTHEHGVSELRRRSARLGGVGRRPPWGCVQAELAEQLREADAVLGSVDRGERVAEQRHAGLDEAGREAQRRLARRRRRRRRAAARARRRRARARASAARGRGGRTCRSPSTPSRDSG